MQVAASLLQTCRLAVIKSISGCVRIACYGLMITSLLQVVKGAMQVVFTTRADFHFFHRRGGKILGGVQVICNIPFLMLREGHEMANQSAPGGWSKILEGLNTF